MWVNARARVCVCIFEISFTFCIHKAGFQHPEGSTSSKEEDECDSIVWMAACVRVCVWRGQEKEQRDRGEGRLVGCELLSAWEFYFWSCVYFGNGGRALSSSPNSFTRMGNRSQINGGIGGEKFPPLIFSPTLATPLSCSSTSSFITLSFKIQKIKGGPWEMQ